MTLLMLLFAAATASTEPTPIGSPGSWLMTTDYPRQALIDNAEGRVQFRLAVDATGKPDACGIVVSSGSQSLDVAACTAVLDRSRFKPATDAAGKPVRGYYSTGINWQVTRTPRSPPKP
jgi:TonB family protein